MEVVKMRACDVCGVNEGSKVSMSMMRACEGCLASLLDDDGWEAAGCERTRLSARSATTTRHSTVHYNVPLDSGNQETQGKDQACLLALLVRRERWMPGSRPLGKE